MAVLIGDNVNGGNGGIAVVGGAFEVAVARAGMTTMSGGALDDCFICSLIFIQTDSLLSHKSYYITSMMTPIYICHCRCSPDFSLIPPHPPCQSPSSRCLPQQRPAPPAPSLWICRQEGVGGGIQGCRCWPRCDGQRQWPLTAVAIFVDAAAAAAAAVATTMAVDCRNCTAC